MEREGFLILISGLASLGSHVEEEQEGITKEKEGEGGETPSDFEEKTQLLTRREETLELVYEVVKLTFSILHLLLHSDEPLLAIFEETIGFDKMGEALIMSRLGISQDGSRAGEGGEEKRMMELMWGFMLGEFGTPTLFGLVLRRIEEVEQQGEELALLPTVGGTPPSPSSPKSTISLIQSLVKSSLSSSSASSTKSKIHYPALVPLLLSLPSTPTLRIILLSALALLVNQDRGNAVVLRDIGLVRICLERLYLVDKEEEEDDGEEGSERGEAVQGEEREVWKGLLADLLELGVGGEEGRRVFRELVVRRKSESEADKGGLNEELLEMV